MASLNVTMPEVLEVAPSLVLSLWDGFTNTTTFAGDLVVSIGTTKPLFQQGMGNFVFGNLADGSYTVNVRSVLKQPYYCPVDIPATVPSPRPADTLWAQPPVTIGYPDIGLADPNKLLDDPQQTAAYMGQRALATLSPTTAYPFPAGTTLVRGVVTASSAPLSGALVTTEPLALPGQLSVVVVNPNGVTSVPQSFVVADAPVIDAIDPPTAIAGSASFMLTAQGSGFKPGAVLKWNATALPTTFLSNGALTAQVTAAQVSAASKVTVVAVNPDGRASGPSTMTVAMAPAVASIDPPSVAVGSPAFTLTVHGSGFLPGAVVQLRNTALKTTWLSSTLLTAQVQPAQIAKAAQMNVIVKNPGTQSSASNIQTLSVTSSPVIHSLEPATLVAAGSAFALTVSGSGFVSGTTAQLGGAALPTAYVSANEVTAQIAATQVAAAGNVSITVSNPDGTLSNTLTLTVVDAPSIDSVEPASAAAGPTAFSLLVRGSGFASGSALELNGMTLATNFVSSTELNAHVPRSGYVTGADGTFVLYFKEMEGLSRTETLTVTHPSFPKGKLLDVTVLRGCTVSASIDMSA